MTQNIITSELIEPDDDIHIPNINNIILQRQNSTMENKELCTDTYTSKDIEILLKQQEEKLRNEIEERYNLEMSLLQERFDYILQNEQIRSSYMLREAYRDRQEKIKALQTQIECKSMAGLMYVLCTERRKAQLERLNITEEYTNRLHELQNILMEAQTLILDLSRGYKAAARIDHEWKQKMKKILFQFQNFVQDFSGGTKEDIQHLFDLPALLHVKTPVETDANEDPCETDADEVSDQPEQEEEKQWWQQLNNDPPPFVVYGDLGDMKPNHRREVLRSVKAVKTAPKKWKDYVFNEMYINDECSNIEKIKNEFKNQYPIHHQETQGVQTQPSYQSSQFSHRMTATNMGSILKIMTNTLDPHHATGSTRSTILGARDSMEIASTSKLLKEKSKDGRHSETQSEKVKLSVGNRRNSILQELARQRQSSTRPICENINKEVENEDTAKDEMNSILGSVAQDSLEMIQDHVPDKDAIIHNEKLCPMEECQHLQVDSFIRSLPPYMRASPFLHFEQTFEEYEPCSPEQLKILQERIELSKHTSSTAPLPAKDNLLNEWSTAADGIATQTSSHNLSPCTCGLSTKSKESVLNEVFSFKDLLPVKATLDKVKKECLFDDRIEFNRFKVVGEDHSRKEMPHKKKEFKNRLEEVQKVLKQNPSFCKMFQANTNY